VTRVAPGRPDDGAEPLAKLLFATILRVDDDVELAHGQVPLADHTPVEVPFEVPGPGGPGTLPHAGVI
jgi:hypothetical protein